jgi:hypothetical protein
MLQEATSANKNNLQTITTTTTCSHTATAAINNNTSNLMFSVFVAVIGIVSGILIQSYVLS